MVLKKTGFCLASGLSFLLMLAIMELNQNTVVGIILTVLLAAAFWAVHRTVLREKRWHVKALGWLIWLLLSCCANQILP